MTALLSQPRPAPSVPAASLRLWKPERLERIKQWMPPIPRPAKRLGWSDKELVRAWSLGVLTKAEDVELAESLVWEQMGRESRPKGLVKS